MTNLTLIIKGFFIGFAAIAPGISGGALAVLMGIYDKLISSINRFFTDTKSSLTLLIPIAIGGGVGVLVFSHLFRQLMDTHNILIRFVFIGLIIGTLPDLANTATKQGFKKQQLIPFAMAFGIGLFMLYLEQTKSTSTDGSPSFFQLISYGVIICSGSVIPGLSTSAILMTIGGYSSVLQIIATIDIRSMIPMAIGFVPTFFLLTKIIAYLFDQYYQLTYAAIIGLVLASTLPLFPGFQFTPTYYVALLAAIICGIITFKLTTLSNRSQKKTL